MKKIKTSKGKEFNATEQGMAQAIRSLKNGGTIFIPSGIYDLKLVNKALKIKNITVQGIKKWE